MRAIETFTKRTIALLTASSKAIIVRPSTESYANGTKTKEVLTSSQINSSILLKLRNHRHHLTEIAYK